LDTLAGGSDPVLLRRLVEDGDPFLEKGEPGVLKQRLSEFEKMLRTRGWLTDGQRVALVDQVQRRLESLGAAETARRRAVIRERGAYEVPVESTVPVWWQKSGRFLYQVAEGAGGVELLVHDTEQASLLKKEVVFDSPQRPQWLWLRPDGSLLAAYRDGTFGEVRLDEPVLKVRPFEFSGPPLGERQVPHEARISAEGDVVVVRYLTDWSKLGWARRISDWVKKDPDTFWKIDLRTGTREAQNLEVVLAKDAEWGVHGGAVPQLHVELGNGYRSYPLAGLSPSGPGEFVETPDGREPFWSADGKHIGFRRFEKLHHSAWRDSIYIDSRVTRNGMVSGNLKPAIALAMHPTDAKFAVLRQSPGGVQTVDWMGPEGLLESIPVPEGKVRFETIGFTGDRSHLVLTGRGRVRLIPF